MKRIFLCELADAPVEGEGKHIDVDNSPGIALFCQAGKYFAVEDNCPHANAPLNDGTVCRGVVTCSWHDWQFDMNTGESLMSEHICIKAFDIIEDDGALWAVLKLKSRKSTHDDDGQLLGEL